MTIVLPFEELSIELYREDASSRNVRVIVRDAESNVQWERTLPWKSLISAMRALARLMQLPIYIGDPPES